MDERRDARLGKDAVPPEEDADDLTLAEAALWLGIAPKTLERWASTGRITSTVTSSGVRMFRRSELVKRSPAGPGGNGPEQ